MSQTETPGVGQPTIATAQPAGTQMKRRGPFVSWLLAIVTFSVYYYVWYFKINKEIGKFDPRRPTKPWVSFLVVFFGEIILVPALVSFYNTGKRIRQAQESAGLEPTCSPVAGTLLSLVFSLHIPYYQSQLNKVVDRYGVPADTEVPLAV